MRRIAVVSVLALCVAGCTPQYKLENGISDQAPTRIEITTRLSADSAQRRARDAAVRGGWTVTADQPGVVTVGPFKLKQYGDFELTMRANVVSATGGGGSVILLSGSYDDARTQAMARALSGAAGATQGKGEAIRYAVKGRIAPVWGELSRFADSVAIATDGTRTPLALPATP